VDLAVVVAVAAALVVAAGDSDNHISIQRTGK